MDYWSKFIVGTGAAINQELGFFPDYVRVANLSDRDALFEGPINTVLNFDGGGGAGVAELKAGDIVEGSASKATGRIKMVAITGGAWSGGNASGIIVLEVDENREGTFADNDDLGLVTQKGLAGAGNYATVNGTAVATTVKSAAAVAAAAAGEAISAYNGTLGSRAKGITLGATLFEDNKLLFVEAFRAGAG